MKLAGVVRVLRGIRQELSRIADCLEADLKDRNIQVKLPQSDPNEPPELFVTDEEADYVQELEEAIKRADGKQIEQEE